MPTQVCVFNPVSKLIDVTPGASVAVGPTAAGNPVVLNQAGLIDPSLTNSGTTAIIDPGGVFTGNLVTLYIPVSGPHANQLVAQPATAASAPLSPVPPFPAPVPNGWPSPCLGFVTAAYNAGVSGTIYFAGTFIYNDPLNEFDDSSIGKQVYLADSNDGLHSFGAITLVPPTTPSEIQAVGLVTNYNGGLVTVAFVPSFPAGTSNVVSFTNVLSGTNASALVVGTGGTLSTSGSGVINANQLTGDPVNTTGRTTGQALVWSGSAWVPSSAGLTGFDDILTGVNTTATMTVGTGASIAVTGTGTVQATKLSTTGAAVVVNGSAPPSIGQILTATSATTAVWATPAGVPGAPSTSVQFNNAGAFGGNAALTWDFPNAFNPPSATPTPALIVGPAGTNEASYQSRLIVNDSFTTPPVSFSGITSSLATNLTGDQSALSFANLDTTLVLRGSAHYGTIYCVDVNFSHQGSGLLDYVNGVYSTLSTNPGSDVTTMVSVWGTCGAQGNAGSLVGGLFIPQFSGPTCIAMAGVSVAVSNATGTVTDCYGLRIDALGNAGTITNAYGVYVGNQKIIGVTNAWGIFVAGGVSQFTGIATSIVIKTANYTATADDATLLGNAAGGTFAFTLPTTGIAVGQTYRIKKIDASVNLLTIASAGNIDGLASISLTTQYQSVDVQWSGSTWWVF